MHQSTSERVQALRNWLSEHNYDAIIIPHEDEYLGEYIPAHNERLHWLTGFTGSAGCAVITPTKAAIFIDGRYTVQVRSEVPDSVFEYRHLIEEPALDWISQNLDAQSNVAFDPRMHTSAWLSAAQDKLASQFSLSAISTNPIDDLWHDRPTAVCSVARLMSISLVGQTSEDKRKAMADKITAMGADCAVITALDSIGWILNIRGLDVSRLPVLLSHVILYSDSSLDFFFDQTRLPDEFTSHVGNNVNVRKPSELADVLGSMTSKKVLIDPATSNAWFTLQLQNSGAHIISASDPCLLPKAQKNSVEIAGMKASHIRDGVAMVNFLCWLDKQVEKSNLLSEAELSDELQRFREQDPTLADLSFDTISAAGGNAAMCHYNHENQAQPTNLTMDSLYLVDSGGQYSDGTTDITRTIAIGQPSSEMTKQFTLVLKGHIAIARARFPVGTCGYQLDTLARQHLWAEGYDYDHGTGHGVGHFLSVHEGPQSISKRPINVPLVDGMVLSNEPGYYRADAFGIRIENLELVTKIESNGDLPLLGFESLTRCPIDYRNIDTDMLTRPELAWINEYHQKVWDELNSLVEGDVKAWLKRATQTLSHD
ncbi:aminopeptidase P family protein [Vibrio genomosp. F10]|uniref:aminopeptidase P family protein n=1 Tax=Vibrio genomosp. F10 TaxID=723171 RepID=UPI000310EB89|nr:aminopeptidase P family protein [Vibrio genomosp. F10]OEF07090.1 X-Pro aminopeptidase [Vibrio genomosp. F10 str. 9ZB36]